MFFFGGGGVGQAAANSTKLSGCNIFFHRRNKTDTQFVALRFISIRKFWLQLSWLTIHGEQYEKNTSYYLCLCLHHSEYKTMYLYLIAQEPIYIQCTCTRTQYNITWLHRNWFRNWFIYIYIFCDYKIYASCNQYINIDSMQTCIFDIFK